jgi:hypothetical protein
VVGNANHIFLLIVFALLKTHRELLNAIRIAVESPQLRLQVGKHEDLERIAWPPLGSDVRGAVDCHNEIKLRLIQKTIILSPALS